MSYFDYTANTPAYEEALQRFCEVERRFIGNANSNHEAGHAAKAFLAQVTDSIAKLLGVNPDEIIYTSGASESNNTAIRGIVQAASSRSSAMWASTSSRTRWNILR